MVMPMWWGPAAMAAWNALYFVMVLLTEGRPKLAVARFAVLYALAVRPAAKGDLEPFVQVLSLP